MASAVGGKDAQTGRGREGDRGDSHAAQGGCSTTAGEDGGRSRTNPGLDPSRLRGSPYGEGKRSMEEYKEFCSGGHVCARTVPGVNLRCPKLRDFGPFAKQEQPPAAPHGSGVQGVGVTHRGVPPTRGAGALGSHWSHWEQHPSRDGESGVSKTLWCAAPQDQRHGEQLLGVTDISLRQTLKKNKQKTPKPSWFVGSANSAAAGQLTSQGPASPALRLQ